MAGAKLRLFFGPALLAVVLAALPACPGKLPPDLSAQAILAADPAAGKILEVPFIAQRDFDCGPASLAMVLRYHGLEADPDAIAAKFKTQAYAGTFTIDLLIAASQAGLEAHWIAADIADLREQIDLARPPIVFENLAPNPLPARHFAVAVGYLNYQGQDLVVLHSGLDPELLVPIKTFMTQWDRTGRMLMTIAPPDPDRPQPKEGPP